MERWRVVINANGLVITPWLVQQAVQIGFRNYAKPFIKNAGAIRPAIRIL